VQAEAATEADAAREAGRGRDGGGRGGGGGRAGVMIATFTATFSGSSSDRRGTQLLNLKSALPQDVRSPPPGGVSPPASSVCSAGSVTNRSHSASAAQCYMLFSGEQQQQSLSCCIHSLPWALHAHPVRRQINRSAR
jgi:hypothetical protein